jgi:hypothetical protein
VIVSPLDELDEVLEELLVLPILGSMRREPGAF